MEYPQAAVAIMPLQPILQVRAALQQLAFTWRKLQRFSRVALHAQLYTSIPFGSLIAFFALYLGVVGNQNFSRFVRFNGQARAVVACRCRPSLTRACTPHAASHPAGHCAHPAVAV